jgi:shikimate dehydrogenase
VISASTRLFAILGDPVAHSLSPVMHNAAFRVLGLDAVYVALRCDSADVGATMRVLARAGGGGNVTVPHKIAAAAVLSSAGERVARLGAANTFWADGDGVRGDNTDVEGILDALRPLNVPPGPWLVVGTGGSARAVAAAAVECGAALAVRSRDAERASVFGAWAAALGAPPAAVEDCVVCINATPLGLGASDPLPLERGAAPRAQVALDLVYHRTETAWVRALRADGLRAADGRAMLVAQGAAAFRCWFPRLRPAVDAMRSAVDAQLR